ncbi:MAG: tetratricopeptide repeat protein [Candidatus Eisenbacteria bacterium]
MRTLTSIILAAALAALTANQAEARRRPAATTSADGAGNAADATHSADAASAAASRSDRTAGESAERSSGNPSSASEWRAVGDAYEYSRLLRGPDRLAALESSAASLDRIVRGADDPGLRAAARLLSARVAWDRGDFAAAAGHAHDAGEDAGKGAFADDAAFVEIEAMEAAGRDAEALKEWARWEKRYPASPLMPAARLAQAWNDLRRAETASAAQRLLALAKTAPWLARDPRFVLARATAMAQAGQWNDALAALGDRPATAEATYLQALVLQKLNKPLKAAAAYQQVAERWGASPLRDPARLAKANTFLAAGDARSAASEFARVVATAEDEAVRNEARLRAAGSVFLSGATDSSLALLRGIVEQHGGTDAAARAQFLIGEALVRQGKPEEAIIEYNRVLTRYFQHRVAASAQYRVARCLDALGRTTDATGSYQAVVTGYPLEPEAPAAAYLAGLGLLGQARPRAAAPYFQIVLDRYARRDARGNVSFGAPEIQELVEAALCMLQYSWHRAGDLGQLAGAPHLMLRQMPPSRSTWRAHALLIDADAMAAQGRYAEAESTLARLNLDFPDHAVGAAAAKLLAWTYARTGRDSLAIATEERLLARAGAHEREDIVSGAFLDIAHARFNQKRYAESAAAYEDFLRRWPQHPRRTVALYQSGVAYLRLNRAGDAVDRWESLVRDSAASGVAERAWARAGDVYFQAGRYDDARRCYGGLLTHFAGGAAAGLASLRMAQCDYNAGRDAKAIEGFAGVIDRYTDTPYGREARRGTELALYRLSRQKGGSATLARLVEQYPTSAFAADALLQIGRQHYQEKEWAQAAESFRQVVSRFPSYSAADQAQFLLADATAQAGDAAEARSAYERFLSFFPASPLTPTVALRLGLMDFEAKDFARAAVSFALVLADSAPAEVRAAARYDLAMCQRQLGATDEARAELGRYREEFPRGAQAAEAAYQLADLDEAAGQLEPAARGFQEALSLRPRAKLAAEIGFRLGRCHERLKQPAAAMRAFREAAAATGGGEPFRLSALARLASLHETRREYTQAVAAYREIVTHSHDRELKAAAEGRLTQLAAHTRR